MKKILLSLLTITAFSTGINAQDSTAFNASEAISFPSPAPSFPKSYALIPTSGSNLILTGDWTLEAWINITFSNGQMHIIESYSTGDTGGFALRISSNRVQAYQIRNQANNSSYVTGTTVIPTGEWHHIAATLNETTDELKVYLDGVLDGTSTTTIATLNNKPKLISDLPILSILYLWKP